MAAITGQYSDEKIFVDPALSEKVTVEGQQNDSPSHHQDSDAPEAVTSTTRQNAEEKITVPKSQPNPEALIPIQKEATLLTNSFEKQHVPPDNVPSPIDQPPQYTSPTQASTSSFFPSNTAQSYREYAFYNAAPWRPTHNTIVDPENCAKYFIEVSEFSKGKQDVSFHDVRSSNAQYSAKRENLSVEEGKSCPVVGFAQYPHGRSDEVRIGVGDPESMGSVRWIRMRREGEKGPWRLVPEGGKEGDRVFEWRAGRVGSVSSPVGEDEAASTSPDLPEASSGAVMPGTLQFVEVETGEVVAMYTELKIGRSLKKRGRLRVYEKAIERVAKDEKDIELLIMLSMAARNEKRRRKTWKKWALLGAG